MNTQEILNKIEQLPSHLIDKKVVISKDSVLELVRQLNDRPKVKIPQFVADYLEQQKQRGKKLFTALFGDNNEAIINWLDMNNNEEIFTRAWLDGYEIEQEKRYRVKFKNLAERQLYLNYDKEYDEWIFVSMLEIDTFSTSHTKDELEEAGFGGVFGNSMFEVEEVE
ncbi:DUF1642 domain-containing protein [Streptococcus cuniculi]|uniref:DUF1642 domain-containing protein n=1 Tax=Streptococcus cuniculi TaxID=1432788 RepID=A0A4Y9JA37_9STRE|nr:DUF1642 domain-containing protein [Streptococcus cuniculi]MBF0778158.1 DUF1642 domain-containing protein [Streptococcus cuniculi]TFU97900.1 DUF1642 domain-containing protein [Streptococcus cuniculi]